MPRGWVLGSALCGLLMPVALMAQFGVEPFTVSEYALLWAILRVNSVSLCFDALDTWRWCRGERDIPGRIPHGQL